MTELKQRILPTVQKPARYTGGEWGEIQFDLVGKSAWVEVFAENDPCDSWKITDCAINAVLKCDEGKLLKRAFIPML